MIRIKSVLFMILLLGIIISSHASIHWGWSSDEVSTDNLSFGNVQKNQEVFKTVYFKKINGGTETVTRILVHDYNGIQTFYFKDEDGNIENEWQMENNEVELGEGDYLYRTFYCKSPTSSPNNTSVWIYCLDYNNDEYLAYNFTIEVSPSDIIYDIGHGFGYIDCGNSVIEEFSIGNNYDYTINIESLSLPITQTTYKVSLVNDYLSFVYELNNDNNGYVIEPDTTLTYYILCDPTELGFSEHLLNIDLYNLTYTSELSCIGTMGVALDFSADVTEGFEPLTVTFTNTSQVENFIPPNEISWGWDFENDGIIDATNSGTVSHTYNNNGVKDVRLVVTRPCGSEEIVQDGYITVYNDEPPVANFTADITSGNSPLEVTFTASYVEWLDTFYWDFDGDGSFDLETDEYEVTHIFEDGEFDVTLEVENGEGATDDLTRTDYITVTKYFDCVGDGDRVNWVSFPCLTSQGTSGGELYEHIYYNTLTSQPGLFQETYGGQCELDGFYRIYGDVNNDVRYLEYNPLQQTFSGLLPNKLFRHKGYKIEFETGTVGQDLMVDGNYMQSYTWDELDESVDYWIGYYLKETQDIDDAFGTFWGDVNKVWAEDWYFDKMNNPKDGFQTPANSTAGKTMEYGKMYIVQMYNDVTDFCWHESGRIGTAMAVQTPQNFVYDEKPDYEAIDILEIPSDITEIGAFQDEVCVGAVVVDSSSAQLLVYPESQSKDEIPYTFEVITGRGTTKGVSRYSVYNVKSDSFEEKPLVGKSKNYNIIKFNEIDETTSLTEKTILNIYPNPFNPNTTISLNIAKEQFVEVRIYNVKGQVVNTLFKGMMTTGINSITWNGEDINSQSVPSGMYFCQIKSNDKVIENKKIMLLK